MITVRLLLASTALAATVALTMPALAADGDGDAKETTKTSQKRAFTTGVAKGRDMLDTAISASTLDEGDVSKISAVSVVDIVGNLPGIRSESSGTDGYSAITIRGLPLASDGSKFLQLQEDGLPILEFGDIHFAAIDQFVRTDLSLAQIQAIRGGSASTFASNSPGGIINFISKTGREAGGAIELSTGLDHGMKRIDFDYGAPLSENWNFNVGGFYRQGEGPRDIGYDAFKGGQLKANVTRKFSGDDYIRVYAKLLDDRQPGYSLYPLAISGTNASPTFANIAGVDIQKDLLSSRYTDTLQGVDATNAPTTFDVRQGNRAKVKAIGLEARFDVLGWTVTEKFRYSRISGTHTENTSLTIAPAQALAQSIAGPGATLSWASGPNAGELIADPTAIGGNGLMNFGVYINVDLKKLDFAVNDLRASRVWNVGSAKVTTTLGLYASSQDIDMYWNFLNGFQSIAPNARSAFIDISTATGIPVTQGGMLVYGLAIPGTDASLYHRRYDPSYRVLAPYGSVNVKLGKLALGASLRRDEGSVSGHLYGGDLGLGGASTAIIDVNGDSTISYPETNVAILPLSQPGVIDYDYGYWSWSVSANYRFSDVFSTFGRYSRGARAGADRMLFPPAHNPVTGKLTDPSTAYGAVKQAEAGVKYRTDALSVFLTGFWASTADQNYQISADTEGNVVVVRFDRTYSAKGVEVEAEWRSGPFGLNLGATWTKSKINRDLADPTLDGNRPRHQPELFFVARPQYETDRFTLGAVINGTTSSYAQDSNILKQPGYVIVSPFAQVRFAERFQLSLNAYNVFDKLAIVQLNAAAIPASGIVTTQVLNGRTLTASLRYDF